MNKRAGNIADDTSRTDGADEPGRAVGEPRMMGVHNIRPNSWNPNVQSDWIYAKELKSIRKFGFVAPIIVRNIGLPVHEIIDGEHRWKAAKDLGYLEIPVYVINVDDDDARELTVVLNELKGKSDEDKLQALLADLLTRRPETEVRDIMPFPKERFDELVRKREIDWGALDQKAAELTADRGRWKELVYRMPIDAAEVVERAIDQMRQQEGIEHPWQCLEMWAADYMA